MGRPDANFNPHNNELLATLVTATGESRISQVCCYMKYHKPSYDFTLLFPPPKNKTKQNSLHDVLLLLLLLF